jgi:hypothetical protein
MMLLNEKKLQETRRGSGQVLHVSHVKSRVTS